MQKRWAALLIAGVFLVGACSDDDSDESGSGSGGVLGNQEDSGDAGGGSDAGGGGGGDGGGGDYPEEARTAFIDSCTAQPGATDESCECAFDVISGTMSYEDYAEWEQALMEDPTTQLPAGLMDAIQSCR